MNGIVDINPPLGCMTAPDNTSLDFVVGGLKRGLICRARYEPEDCILYTVLRPAMD